MIQKRHLQTMNQVQHYFSNSFEIKNVTDGGYLSALKEREAAKKTFLAFLQEQGILELQLLPLPYPDSDADLFDTLNLRVTRFSKTDSKQDPLDPATVAKALCTYTLTTS